MHRRFVLQLLHVCCFPYLQVKAAESARLADRAEKMRQKAERNHVAEIELEVRLWHLLTPYAY